MLSKLNHTFSQQKDLALGSPIQAAGGHACTQTNRPFQDETKSGGRASLGIESANGGASGFHKTERPGCYSRGFQWSAGIGLKGGSGRFAPNRECYCCRTNLIRIYSDLFSPNRDDEFRRAAREVRNERNPNHDQEAVQGDMICGNCIQTVNKKVSDDANKPLLNVVLQNKNHCLVCPNRNNLRNVTLTARVDVFKKRDIYIPSRSKICPVHLTEDETYIQDAITLGLVSIKRRVSMDGNEVVRWMEALRQDTLRKQTCRFHDPDSFTDEEFTSLTCLTKDQFLDLKSHCEQVEVYGQPRNVHTEHLIMFLCKLRHGLSDDFLKVMFEMPSRQATSLAITVVRTSLRDNFVPLNLSPGAITRDDFIRRHVTAFSNELFNPDPKRPRVIIIIDGTYLKVTKSFNHRVLRQSYCFHKKQHMLKPIMIVAPNGYILDVQGPYFSDSKNNDGTILVKQLENNLRGLREWLQEGDIVVVDRGYRDALGFLEELGIQTEMPGFVLGDHRQGSWEDANKSRLVTKCRWIVETRNGHLKNIFKFFKNEIQPVHYESLSDFLRIACAIINKYKGEVLMKNADVELAREMLLQANVPNTLGERVHANNWHLQHAQWEQMDGTNMGLPSFPHLTLEYLRDITFGTYQIRLSDSYTHDKRRKDEGYSMRHCLFEPGIIRSEVPSRHKNTGNYHVFVSFIPNLDEAGNLPPQPVNRPIDEWYCNCPVGARTLGMCAHVASVLWYLGYARHQREIKYPKETALQAFLDAADRPVPDDPIVV